jgi:hypothetical protein
MKTAEDAILIVEKALDASMEYAIRSALEYGAVQTAV